MSAVPTQELTPDTELEAFLSDLTTLSLKHKIGIAVPVKIFVMEDNDLSLAYHCDAEGNLTF